MADAPPDHLILCYHAVSSTWRSALSIPERLLEEQLSLLKKRGYEGFTFAEWERRRAADELPRRSVVATFDDGYASTLRAVPILERLGFPGTVFPVLSFLESGELLRWPGIEEWSNSAHADELTPLSWDQLEELAASGWEVGSHTVTHPHLEELDDDDLGTELRESRAAIAKRLGSCETLAYPFGKADRRVAGATARAGYLAGCTLERFNLVDQPHLRHRIGLYDNDSGVRLRLKVSQAGSAIQRSRLIRRLLSGSERSELARR